MFLSAAEALQSEESTVWIDLCEDRSDGWLSGAHLVAFDDIVSSEGDTGGLLPPIDHLNKVLAHSGVGPDKRVVIYDDQNNLCASRLAWTLIECGLKEVCLVDGGKKALRSAGAKLVHTRTTPSDDTVELSYTGAYTSSAEDILCVLDDPAHRPLDARTAEEFHGQDVRSAHGGHIPGAIHLDWQECVSPEDPAFLRPREELEQLLENRGIHQGQTLYLYCQTHRRSSLLFCILRMLGYRHLKGYPGAWSDWGNRADLPKHHTT